MEQTDFYNQHTTVSGAIHCADALTQNAAPNSEYEAHVHHDKFEIYWFLEGDLSLAFEGDRIAIQPGDMVILCSSQLHRPIILRQCRYHRKRILFHKDIFARLGESGWELQKRLSAKRLLKLSAAEITQIGADRLFGDIMCQLANGTSYGEFCASVSLMQLLISAEGTCPGLPAAEQRRHTGFSYEIIRYIDKNLSADLSYHAIARQFHISEKSLYKHFRQETGFTLSKYIKERRIIKAKSLLNAGIGAFDAAAAAGFQDYSVFFRSFVKAVGCSPAQYAKNKGSD